ncbi:DNA cytosine methyltransferase [Carboxylicivirga sp. RSCT41]|uniref:DNA cytosine methyltransferase n=1 Tax=Carboxylicivirga agarovorans TaxID=3417570 RepID=UPI003D355FF4
MNIEYDNLEIGEAKLKEVKEQLSFYHNLYIDKKSDKKQLNVLSLFSGCGGMDLGFEGGFLANKKSISKKMYKEFVDSEFDDCYVKLKPTRFKTIFANDIFKDARNTWIANFATRKYKPETFHSESIVNLVKLHELGIKVFPENVDLVTGGFPCQDFSISGKRNGFHSHRKHDGKVINGDLPTEETRGKLYFWMKKVIEITKPKVFVAENVKGLVNLSDVKEIIQKDFSSANGNGYIVLEPQLLHSADYGVSQSRERVIFIGIKKSELKPEALKQLMKKKVSDSYNPYPEPTHSKDNRVPLSIILKDLPEPELSNDLSQMFYSKAKFMGKHCQGQTEVNLMGLAPTIRAEHHGNIEFRRLSIANGGKYRNEIESGKIERRLSVRECGLIQSFPPDFEFVIKSNEPRKKFLVSPSQAYKVIGNAVPPLMAYNLSRRIDKLWDKYFI